MAPKRKFDVLDPEILDVLADNGDASTSATAAPAPPAKKARASGASEASSSKRKKAKEVVQPKNWTEIILEGEGESDGVPVYDDCNEIRRKIRLLRKTSDWKVTHWLKDIGNVNSNSYNRFMKATGPTGGASNGVYYAAYVYFEKVRIAEGKKKTAKRLRNEDEYPSGIPLEDRRRVWVFGPA
ncbi:hypothetical protein A0H81_00656 [Grifola frondosa]|uniref:DUF7726 domain-containing protein n=1 Tax=Grifola frondosa TaxID=5627 RepID=A0A1C7MRD1_GRIFR|nr:hypothetical protein A0H81_00656 [Grifola frondosa]